MIGALERPEFPNQLVEDRLKAAEVIERFYNVFHKRVAHLAPLSNLNPN